MNIFFIYLEGQEPSTIIWMTTVLSNKGSYYSGHSHSLLEDGIANGSVLHAFQTVLFLLPSFGET